MRLPSVVALLASSLAAVPAVPLMAHPGGLDSQGCHNNRKTGDYHCHRGGSARSGSKSRSYGAINSLSEAFRNCSVARAAGAAPVREGDPGYGRHLDRDGDGVGCE